MEIFITYRHCQNSQRMTCVERATSLTERRLYRGAFERQGSKWLLHTGVGHYDLTEGKHYYYIKDNLGSTVAVVDGDGV
ncbi:MAG: hypothetical protein PUE25_06690, partial [bacterium]|nr:hypothetical protein [bacterium]